MGNLREESELYNQLCVKYEKKGNKDISLEFFKECVDLACKASPVEIRFILFKLKCLNAEENTGVGKIDDLLNSMKKVLDTILGKNMKIAFITAVLEMALEDNCFDRKGAN